jgi:hypothetical protein
MISKSRRTDPHCQRTGWKPAPRWHARRRPGANRKTCGP